MTGGSRHTEEGDARTFLCVCAMLFCALIVLRVDDAVHHGLDFHSVSGRYDNRKSITRPRVIMALMWKKAPEKGKSRTLSSSI